MQQEYPITFQKTFYWTQTLPTTLRLPNSGGLFTQARRPYCAFFPLHFSTDPINRPSITSNYTAIWQFPWNRFLNRNAHFGNQLLLILGLGRLDLILKGEAFFVDMIVTMAVVFANIGDSSCDYPIS